MMTKLILSLSGLVALAGCTLFIPTPPHMAATEISPNVQVVGTVEGESRANYIMGFGPFGDNSLKSALQDALSKRGGDAVINVSVDSAITDFFGIFTIQRTMVMGTAVKYPK